MASAARRVTLIHWNRTEAEMRARTLRAAGYRVEILTDPSLRAQREMRANPPEAFAIDLSRIPSQGTAVGVWLRQQKASRHVPLLFVGGDPEKVARVRSLLPDAAYSEWRRIRGDLRRALARRPTAPVVPGTMDAYAGAPLPKKLGIRAGTAVVLLGEPAGFVRTLGTLPGGARVTSGGRGPANVVLLFTRDHAELARRFSSATAALAHGGGIWVVWPKQTSSLATDLTLPGVRAFGLAAGFVDYKVTAIDETYSGLLLTRRRAQESRPRVGRESGRGTGTTGQRGGRA